MLAVCATPRHYWPTQEKELIEMAPSEDYDLIIRQQPRDALLAQDGKEKSECARGRSDPSNECGYEY